MSHEIDVVVAGRTGTLRFGETVRLGRAETNGIVVNDPVVSGQHLELRRTGDVWEIIDLGSSNGTYIDGLAITTAHVGAATTLTLGYGGPEVRVTVPAEAQRVRSSECHCSNPRTTLATGAFVSVTAPLCLTKPSSISHVKPR